MLKEFCSGMLESGYNVMMKAIKDRISREKAQDSDESYYFWAMSFFLEFNRYAADIGFKSRTEGSTKLFILHHDDHLFL